MSRQIYCFRDFRPRLALKTEYVRIQNWFLYFAIIFGKAAYFPVKLRLQRIRKNIIYKIHIKKIYFDHQRMLNFQNRSFETGLGFDDIHWLDFTNSTEYVNTKCDLFKIYSILSWLFLSIKLPSRKLNHKTTLLLKICSKFHTFSWHMTYPVCLWKWQNVLMPYNFCCLLF